MKTETKNKIKTHAVNLLGYMMVAQAIRIVIYPHNLFFESVAIAMLVSGMELNFYRSQKK